MKKITIMFILFYLLALTFYFMPSIKFPDVTMNFTNMFITVLFLVTLITLSVLVKNKGIKLFLITGTIEGILVFLINKLESSFFENLFYEVIAFLQYPIYIVFITPFFGGNSILHVNYGLYSLLVAAIYLIILILHNNTSKVIQK
ncbi:hypothetical protein [Ornithinibacillus scapharcae]|uniref:hypothetical protein n=1 Tax=Ornithinibacillus scapharcae TaxID=1147159 RepID=UPI000225BD1C|nr:hypothetical protein [Ornithinibacillus scapharcae]